jgi:hypothetical protein
LNVYLFVGGQIKVETNCAYTGSKVVHMKDIARKPVLNPAFKRFQYLPHLPVGAAAKHACAAPPSGEIRGVLRACDSTDAQRDRLNPLSANVQTEAQPRNWEFQSPA